MGFWKGVASVIPGVGTAMYLKKKNELRDAEERVEVLKEERVGLMQKNTEVKRALEQKKAEMQAIKDQHEKKLREFRVEIGEKEDALLKKERELQEIIVKEHRARMELNEQHHKILVAQERIDALILEVKEAEVELKKRNLKIIEREKEIEQLIIKEHRAFEELEAKKKEMATMLKKHKEEMDSIKELLNRRIEEMKNETLQSDRLILALFAYAKLLSKNDDEVYGELKVAIGGSCMDITFSDKLQIQVKEIDTEVDMTMEKVNAYIIKVKNTGWFFNRMDNKAKLKRYLSHMDNLANRLFDKKSLAKSTRELEISIKAVA